jgi:hypothetical protein
MALPKPGNVIVHTPQGDVEMPESQALPYKPQPIVEGEVKFLWTRNIYVTERQMFQERFGESVRFADAVSPITGEAIPVSVAVFVREDHDYHTLKAGDFQEKYGWA